MSVELKSEYDVAIVGAGPAGSSTAIRLAQNGVKVLLIEQKKFPRAKLCGEFISPECLKHFAELNVLDEMSLAGGVTLNKTVFYARNARSVTVPSEWFDAGSHALGLSRAEMDQQLLLRARRAGAEVLEETQAVNLLFENEKVCGVRLRDKNQNAFEVKASLTIDATGRSRILARQIEKINENGKRSRADFVAFKTHLAGANISDNVCEIYSYRGGYGGCSPVENGLYNLCFIVSSELARKNESHADKILANVVLSNSQAAESLRNASPVEDWLAVPINGYGRANLAPAEGLLSIGDAAGFIDPFTGSGILLALESAKLAAEVILSEFSLTENKPRFATISANYRERYGREFGRRLFVSSLIRHVAFVPRAADVVIKCLAASRTMSRLFAKATRRSVPAATQ